MQWVGWIIGVVTLICLFLIIWIAVRDSKDIPKSKQKPINKLSKKELKRMLK